MSDRGPQEGGFEITPDEDRFLRAFFRRHAARYMVAMGLVAAVAVWSMAPEGVGPVGLLEDQGAELDALRAENERLRGELAQLTRRVASLDAVPNTTKQVVRLEERMAYALKRLERVESRAAKPAAAAGSSVEVSAALDRLYHLEARQDSEEQSRETFEKSVLNRLHAIENQRDSLADASTSTQQSILERVGVLEEHADSLERGLGGERAARAVPAAPAP